MCDVARLLKHQFMMKLTEYKGLFLTAQAGSGPDPDNFRYPYFSLPRMVLSALYRMYSVFCAILDVHLPNKDALIDLSRLRRGSLAEARPFS